MPLALFSFYKDVGGTSISKQDLVKYLTKALLLWASCSLSVHVFAQEQNEARVADWNVSSEMGRGAFLPHRSSLQHLRQGPAQVFGLSLETHLNNDSTWHRWYNAPYAGLSVRYFYLGNEDVLGRALAIAPYLKIPLMEYNRWRWNLLLNAGAGYITKQFDPETNYKNNAIGSALNAFLSVQTQLEVDISERWNLATTVSFYHFSNAAFSLPNLGINYPTVSANLGYRFNARSISVNKPLMQYKPLKWVSWLNVGACESRSNNGHYYPTFYASASRFFHLSNISAIVAHADVFNNVSLLGNPEMDSVSAGNILSNHQFGLRADYSMKAGALYVNFGVGAYLYDAHRENGAIYNRLSIHYRLLDSWLFDIGLKTHLFTAEFVSIGLGYAF